MDVAALLMTVNTSGLGKPSVRTACKGTGAQATTMLVSPWRLAPLSLHYQDATHLLAQNPTKPSQAVIARFQSSQQRQSALQGLGRGAYTAERQCSLQWRGYSCSC